MIAYSRKFLIGLIFIFLTGISAGQSLNLRKDISIGLGDSFYKNIRSKQIILFYNVPNLNTKIGDFDIEGYLNPEFIYHQKNTIFLIGLAPMFRYNMNLLFADMFFKAGVGINYVNSKKIGTRNIGGNFIFSDMISVGLDVLHSKSFSLEVSYLFRHLSNAKLFKSNEGYNSQYLVISLII